MKRAIVIAIMVVMILTLAGCKSTQRAFKTVGSEISGIDRHIKVMTATGEVIAEFDGVIDIESSDGGKVLFDYEGKRYVYYNCLVEAVEK